MSAAESSRTEMRELAAKTTFFLLALPAVLRAALRLAWHNRHCGIHELADRLRAVPPWGPTYLDNPRFLEGSASRLLKLLPPRRFGPCLKRSCLLLDLWSRCGLRPRLHVGTLKDGEERRFHAWVSVPGSAAGGSVEPGYDEIWSG